MLTENGLYTFLEIVFGINMAFSAFLRVSNHFSEKVKSVINEQLRRLEEHLKANKTSINKLKKNVELQVIFDRAVSHFRQRVNSFNEKMELVLKIFTLISIMLGLIILTFLYLGREQIFNNKLCFILILPLPVFCLLLYVSSIFFDINNATPTDNT